MITAVKLCKRSRDIKKNLGILSHISMLLHGVNSAVLTPTLKAKDSYSCSDNGLNYNVIDRLSVLLIHSENLSS